MISSNKQMVLHPIMFALYPAAFLYTGNRALVDFSATLGPAAVCAAFAAVVWLCFTKLFSDWNRAAAATSALLMAVFSYSSIARSLQSLAGGGDLDLWSKILAGCLMAVLASAVAVLRSPKYLSQINYVLNVVSIFLVAGPLFQAALWNYSMSSLAAALPDRTEFNANPLPEGTDGGPDIYYFVLDGYARQDVLERDYDYDNSELIDALERRGFKIAARSVANYPYTLVSVNSSLNFTYLQDVIGSQLAAASDQRFLRELMQDSRAVRLLKSAGYRIVSFESEYWGANIGGVDVNLQEWWFLEHFSLSILQMTPLPAILEAAGYPLLYEMHRERTEYPFVNIRDAVDQEGPKFVYAHMFFGHPPFVFGENGERLSIAGDYRWELADKEGKAAAAFIEGYRSQTTYLNKRLLEAVDEILANSDRDPIIIMHGDHGPGVRYDAESLENTDVAERFNVFYAAHLPDGGNEDIYDSMTPVNGFRVVFNRYFGTDYDILEDRAFFSPHSRPYEYVSIPGFPGEPVEELAVDHQLLGSQEAGDDIQASPGGD